MVLQLRELADDPLLPFNDLDDPLVQGVRHASAMVEAALRFIQAFPDAASAQLRLCDGLDGLMVAVAERITALTSATARRRLDRDQVDTVAHWIVAIHEGRRISSDALLHLSAELTNEAHDGAPLRFLTAGSPAGANWLARHVAAHGLVTAQVVARLQKPEFDYTMSPDVAVLAAMVHDIGLLSIPVEVLAQPGPLSDEQMRTIERHPHQSAESVAPYFSKEIGLFEAVASHHERLDGSGYPAGLTGFAIAPCARLLAVADVYAARVSPRPHRPAADPRTALTETLMQAERGALDRSAAERLLALTFYPVGTIVELSDGSVARVVAVHPPQTDVHAPARPVVQVLADSRGWLAPYPETLDLSACDGRAVVRTLPMAQRRRLLSPRYSEWAA
jgi:hypothetical protein